MVRSFRTFENNDEWLLQRGLQTESTPFFCSLLLLAKAPTFGRKTVVVVNRFQSKTGTSLLLQEHSCSQWRYLSYWRVWGRKKMPVNTEIWPGSKVSWCCLQYDNLAIISLHLLFRQKNISDRRFFRTWWRCHSVVLSLWHSKQKLLQNKSPKYSIR